MMVGNLPIEDTLILETREIVSLSVILAAIALWNLIIVWQIRSHTRRLVREIRAMGNGLSDAGCEQAHQEQTP